MRGRPSSLSGIRGAVGALLANRADPCRSRIALEVVALQLDEPVAHVGPSTTDLIAEARHVDHRRHDRHVGTASDQTIWPRSVLRQSAAPLLSTRWVDVP